MWTCGGTRLCCSGSERRRVCTPKGQSGPLRICILVLGCRRSSITHQLSCLITVSHVSQSSRGTWSSRCMQRRRHTLRTTPTHRHTTHKGRLSRTIGHRAANTSPHRWGQQQRHLPLIGRADRRPGQHWQVQRASCRRASASFAAYDVEFVVEISRCRAPLHRSTGDSHRRAADVELYSSTALSSALQLIKLYSSTALYILHPLHPP